jgi:transposase
MQTISMSVKDLDRGDIINRLIRKEIKQGKAAQLLNLSVRQVKRLKKRVERDGVKSLAHALRGKPGNRRLPKEECKKIEEIVRTHYHDFSVAFATEKLYEEHAIDHDPKTIRDIMLRANVWSPVKGRKKTDILSWRPRRSSFGELQQFDGSYHAWLEDRFTDECGSHELCLLASVDDATGKITRLEFAPHEGVFPVFAFWRGYLETHGKPRDIYLDRFSTYRMNPKFLQEQPELRTQFERAMKELDIGLITAHTPQAKGRVERLFQTLQDRLVKELRLAGITTVEAANVFLKETYLSKFNKQFSVTPADANNLHRSLSKKEQGQLSAIFSVQHPRVIRNDFTLSFDHTWYQIRETTRLTPRPKESVMVETRLDGTILFRLRGKYLNTEKLPARPVRVSNSPRIQLETKKPSHSRKPAINHPWRKRILADIRQHQKI